MDNQLITYLLIFFISSIAILCIGLVVLYLRLIAKYQALTEINSKLSRPEFLSQAEELSKKLIQEARIKSAEIISKSEIFSEGEKKLLQEEINKTIQTYASNYQQSLKLAQDQYIKGLSSIPKDIELQVSTEVDTFRKIIQDELLKSQEAIKSTLKESYNRAEVEVEKYKETRLKQLDDSILKVVEEVSRKVLAKEITQEEHEKLVLKALEEAKRSKFFSSGGKEEG